MILPLRVNRDAITSLRGTKQSPNWTINGLYFYKASANNILLFDLHSLEVASFLAMTVFCDFIRNKNLLLLPNYTRKLIGIISQLCLQFAV